MKHILIGALALACAAPPAQQSEHSASEHEQPAGRVFLTFDDGPINATLGVLDILAEQQVSATFFVNGFHLIGEGDESEDRAAEALERLVAEGHVLANHSFDHMLSNCCQGETCGAAICNQLAAWNVGAYQDAERETANFHPRNTELIRSYLPSESTELDRLDSMARLPYTNAWRVGELEADCPCCTSDRVQPWDPAFDCSPEQPTTSASIAAEVADRLVDQGFIVYGWDLEWSPANWGDDDPVSTLTSAEELAAGVHLAATGCPPSTVGPSHSQPADFPCDSPVRAGKVIVLTHDFLFEDGKRGQGAEQNLPKLRRFIEIMREDGFVFDTLDNYLP